jgi:hypothetical protein
MSREHIRVLLGQQSLGSVDVDVLSTQLAAALDGPPLLYLSSETLAESSPQVAERLAQSWEDLIRRICPGTDG